MTAVLGRPTSPHHRRYLILPARLRCPDCGQTLRDRISARFGYCDSCQEFTAMCGAGRRVVCPDLMTNTTWHMPCTALGAVAWDITVDGAAGSGVAGSGVGSSRRALLCPAHDADVRSGVVRWIEAAVPVAR